MSEIDRHDVKTDRPADLVPQRCTLDGFALESGCADGVAIQSLEAGTVVALTTQHTRYRLVVLDPARQRVLVTGGAHFPESTEARLEGATVGGSVVKMGWLGVGLRLELSAERRRIITSPVQSISIESVPALTSTLLTS